MERGEGTLLRSPGRRKALEGEAQECWGLKEASKAEGIRKARQEGSQTLRWDFLRAGQRFSGRFLKEE
jgi:hypothetical protein